MTAATTSCVVDTSALIAIALVEDAADALTAKLLLASHRYIGAPSVLEAQIVLAQRAPHAPASAVVNLLNVLAIEEVGFTAKMREHAHTAWQSFGKGRHPAALNYGDCMSYAVATAMALPLLYIGNDFSRTDIQAA